MFNNDMSRRAIILALLAMLVLLGLMAAVLTRRVRPRQADLLMGLIILVMGVSSLCDGDYVFAVGDALLVGICAFGWHRTPPGTVYLRRGEKPEAS